MKQPRLLGGIFAVGAALAAGGLLVRRALPQSAPPAPTAAGNPVLLAEAVRVRAASAPQERTISGQVEPFAVATISAEVSARVVARPPKRGDRVAPGDLLA